jgi:uncharacterized membrane protein
MATMGETHENQLPLFGQNVPRRCTDWWWKSGCREARPSATRAKSQQRRHPQDAKEVEVSPFDIKSALLAKHAQHVVIVHFPIALSLMSWFFDVLARWRRSLALASAAYYNLAWAAISSLGAVATGLAAWQWQLGGARLKGNLRLHLIFALMCSVMLWVLWLLRKRDHRAAKPPGTLYFLLATIAAVAIAVTGHLGGFLSGVNLPGE